MTIRLADLVSKFTPADDREGPFAQFRTHTPWVAPEAYLNIVFKGADPKALVEVGQKLRLPTVFQDFLKTQNGAILFSSALSIYGVHRQGQLLNRADSFAQLPFNIETENKSWLPPDPTHLLALGGYGYDGSHVCIDRRDLRVHLFAPNATSKSDPDFSWRDLDEWITSEVARLSALFDEDGRCNAPRSQTIPSHPV